MYVEPFLDAFFVETRLLTCAPAPIEVLHLTFCTCIGPCRIKLIPYTVILQAYRSVTHKVFNRNGLATRILKYFFQKKIEYVDYAAWRLKLDTNNRLNELQQPLQESDW